MANNQTKDQTSQDGCFIINPNATNTDLGNGVSLRLSQIQAIAVQSIGVDESMRDDLTDALLLNVQWLAHDCQTLMTELGRRLGGAS